MSADGSRSALEPTDDPTVANLASATRERVARIWAERAKSELGAGSGFAQVVVGLYSVGARPEVLALATRAAHEEVEHARACHRLAEHYLGEEVAMPRAKKVGMPPHTGTTDARRAHLHVVGLCCFNETIAADFVARCLDESEAALVRESCSTHLRDEIGHARVGWAHLASGVLDAADRKVIARWLPRLVRDNGSAWLSRVRTLPDEGVPGHGYPPVRELERGIRHALREIVIPGLARCGLDVSAARSELERL